MTFGYRAFISYSHRDKTWGEWLHRKLETYRVPKKIVGKETPYGPIPRRLTPIFRDRDELATADDLSEEINAALKASQFLLVICSPASAQSRWVNEEIKTFKRIHGEGMIRAVIVGGEPFSGNSETECFPEALRFKFDDDGKITTEHAEPIAADLRPGGDGKKYAISKLVAGLTGAKLDELLQREQVRHNQRMRAVAAGFGTIAVAMGALAYDAMRQRDVARVARDDAEILIANTLDELKPDIAAFSNLESWTAIASAARDYYGKQDVAKLTPDQLGRSARVLLMLGEADNLRGDLDAALTAYTAAAATTEEQLRRDPDNPDRIFDHSQSVFWVGYIAWQRGDADTARQYWTQYYDQANRLVEIDPDNDDYQAELEYSFSNLGTLEMDQGNAAAAEGWFNQSLSVSKALAEKYPDDVERQIAAGQSYSWLAEALYHQAKIKEAREAREAEITVYEIAKANSENDALIGNNESIARYSYADILLSEGRVESAVTEANNAVVLADQLFNADSTNLHLADRAVLARSIYGEALLHAGYLSDARQVVDSALEIANRLVSEDPTNLRWRGKVAALPELQLALYFEKVGDAENAAIKVNSIIEMLRPLVETEISEIAALRVYLTSLACQARLSGQHFGNWALIISSLEKLEGQHGPKTITLAIEAHAQLGNEERALELSRPLYDSGFRHPDLVRLIDTHSFLTTDEEMNR